MNKQEIERRRYERIVFTMEDEISAILVDKDDKSSKTHVLLINLSQNGMHCTLRSSDRKPFLSGDRVVLVQIDCKQKKYSGLNIDVEIRWVLNPPTLRYIGIGCQFLSMAADNRELISEIQALTK